ncbi:hypothetical protein SDC9_167542 [bioreactor metagenome]|uniref:Uncharacterized protein n=1 Tax=bioreactor metagenome TaxID=1076179 RepID=A0A645G0K3_9ZZZZ
MVSLSGLGTIGKELFDCTAEISDRENKNVSIRCFILNIFVLIADLLKKDTAANGRNLQRTKIKLVPLYCTVQYDKK